MFPVSECWLFIIAWLAVGIQPSSEVLLTKKKEDTHLPIECSLNSDISFKFTNKQSKKTQTIAACSTNINSCYLSDKVLAQSYAIAKSDVGGILFIIDVGEYTFGTYTCYETYNVTNLAAVDVSFKDIEASTHSSTAKVIEESTLTFIGLVLDGVQTVLLVVCIVCVVCKMNCCKPVSECHPHDSQDSKSDPEGDSDTEMKLDSVVLNGSIPVERELNVIRASNPYHGDTYTRRTYYSTNRYH